MSDSDLQAEARRRLGARRDFVRTMVVFLVVAVVLIAIWAMTGAPSYFWPMWPIGALVVAAIFMALNTFGILGGELRQADVDAEVERMRRRSCEMSGADLALHVTLIVIHAAAATGSFVLGILLIASPPTSRIDGRLRAFIALAVVAMVTLVTVVAVDWARLPDGKRIAFAVLCALAAYLLVRVAGARRTAERRPEGWRRSFIGHVGFVLISLFDGFCIVTAIDLHLPPPAIVAAAVLGVVVGVAALRRAIRRDGRREAPLAT